MTTMQREINKEIRKRKKLRYKIAIRFTHIFLEARHLPAMAADRGIRAADLLLAKLDETEDSS